WDVADQRVDGAARAPDQGLAARPGEAPALEVGHDHAPGVGREVLPVEATPLLEEGYVGEPVVVDDVEDPAGAEDALTLVAGGQAERQAGARQRLRHRPRDRSGRGGRRDRRLLDGDPVEGEGPLEGPVLAALLPTAQQPRGVVAVGAL